MATKKVPAKKGAKKPAVRVQRAAASKPSAAQVTAYARHVQWLTITFVVLSIVFVLMAWARAVHINN